MTISVDRGGALCLFLGVIIFLGGCAVPQQVVKGGPMRLSLEEQESVDASLSSSKRLAVVVGIDRFRDRRWPSLHYAEKDADDMASVLNDQRYGHFDRVISLTEPQQTTKSSILAAIEEVSRQNLSKNDTVIFYISSHGTIARAADNQLHQYVVAQDSRFDNIPDTAIDLNDIRKAFDSLVSRKKALIFAFCHSGQGKSQLDDEMASELKTIKTAFFVKPIELASEATVVLAASAWGETAREDGNLKNDIYTHFLIEGIKKGDRNGDGAVSITEAHDYARGQTYYYTHGEQRPTIESVILGTDPIILSGDVRRVGSPVVYDYSRRYEGLAMFIDGEKKGILPMGVAVDSGVHTVELRTGDGVRPLYEEAFTAHKGEEILLPVLLDGYDHGAALRVVYQGFMSEQMGRSVSKPLITYGLSYSDNAYFSPHVGYRADLSYGRDVQNLTVGHINTSADVSQTVYGVALLYRYAAGGMALYGGPRVGGLYITRRLAVGNLGNQKDSSATLGGILGLNFRYRKRVAFAIEGAINAASMGLENSNAISYFYSLAAGLSVNF